MNSHVVILTTCSDDWGGSEELWAKSVPFIRDAGHSVTVCKAEIALEHPKFIELKNLGVTFQAIYPDLQGFGKRLIRRVGNELWKWRNRKNGLLDLVLHGSVQAFETYLRRAKPAFVIISQGINFDGLAFAHPCLKLGIPYVIIAQKAVDFYWPGPQDRRVMRELLLHAKRCFFVSKHNLRLTEEQFGVRLTNGEVIFNPIKISSPIPYPALQSTYRFCCIARLFILDKGQDMLLRVLSLEKWKRRPIHVSFIGKGMDKEALMELAALLDVKNVSFEGYTDRIDEVWKTHHMLVLPSRSEGLPLTIMEAMMAGRPVITTDAGGNAEFLEDGVSGYISLPAERSLDEAMERAWQQRDRWQEIGQNASKCIAREVPSSPEEIFGKKILAII
ncbi:glycosyltransferase family 4 protein [Parapedobacter sp. 10938]|uniref:glycosyltransferase family 4 protein n=1 Tax=Parapedobacter flavus TaxID=3110225 RepID=UPI002DBCD180|nr:glycosyltransferase family 4 protein [Parapedobacter sp. 10938]MEC3879910.1 glycosyltransferase family 4 protein [Parapedobacter sp. 10938]